MRIENGLPILAACVFIIAGVLWIAAGLVVFHRAFDGGRSDDQVAAMPQVSRATWSPFRITTHGPTPSPYPDPTLQPTPVPFSGRVTLALFDQKLTDCGAYPNGSVHQVRATGRFFFSLPQDLFPDISGFEFVTASGDARAGWVSNAGSFGNALGGRPGCWNYYFMFVGSGETILSALSPVEGAPEYKVHFIVEVP
jgi:hypothetical protein